MTKSRAYMKNAEFKARQLWLAFEDAVGIVLEVLEPVKEATWNWYKEWRRNFRSKPAAPAKPIQMIFQFITGDFVTTNETFRG